MIVLQGITMPAEAPAKPKQETWRDWMPEGSAAPKMLFLRDEFIDRLRELGVRVDAPTLRLWERTGVLPRVVKEWRGDANYAVYPLWMMGVVVLLRDLQREGLSLAEIGPALRETAPSFISEAATIERLRERAGPTFDEEFADTIRKMILDPIVEAIGHVFLDEAARTYASRVQRLTGRTVKTVVTTVRDEKGEEVVGPHFTLIEP